MLKMRPTPTTTITSTAEEHQGEKETTPLISHVSNAGKRDTTRATALALRQQNESKERETGTTMLMAGAAQEEFDDDNIEFMFLQPAKGRSAS
jgi:hypothetical protein